MHRAKKVVHQFVHRARSNRAEMNNLFADGIHEWPGAIKNRIIRPDQKDGVAGLNVGRNAGYGRVDIGAACCCDLCGKFQNEAMRQGGTFNRQCFGFHGRKCTVNAQPDGLGTAVVGHKGDYDIGIAHRIGRCGAGFGPQGNKRFGFSRASVPDLNSITLFKGTDDHCRCHAASS